MRTGGLKRWLLAGTFAVAAICARAAAQETGTLITHKAAQVEYRGKKAARTTMEAFTGCIVSRSRGRAVRFVSMRVDDPGYQKSMRSLFDSMGDECLSSGDLAFSDTIFRGAIFQALYAAEFPNDGPIDFASVPTSGFREAYGAQAAPAAVSTLALEHFGECVARADGQGVRNLLGALPSSAHEAMLFNALVPRFSGCIPKGETLAFSKVILKGALAEGMYWLSKAAQNGAAGTH